ncbi:DNA replication and repair protein RecO [Pseudomonas duriflava]|uniref:DNA repair protein RecO n=1 Tax=Pseudomonas duriflava TaxID=459528 RepID=A0A562QPV3_9PSED|nr:DNA repair protein RecO [Pseudomonas duriflava]TWI58791.1 DNA replication and repair protein RecO [Pseudomonas duriflava]
MHEPEQVFVLHTRPYRESSLLIDLFSLRGRFRVVYRAARNRLGSQVRPFQLFECELRGRTELKSVSRMEPLSPPVLLKGDALFSGLYLNELVVRLLLPEDPHPAVFHQYAATLHSLSSGSSIEPPLRTFEWSLLDELGYGFSLEVDNQGNSIDPSGIYRFVPDEGLELIIQYQPGAFHGSELLSLARADWNTPDTLKAAKRLMRQAYAPLLDGKPLVSRELFFK